MQKQLPKAYILVSNDRNDIQRVSAYTAKSLSSIVKSCLGPRAMQKMVLTKINSIELTNDGNSILREMDVSHPSARCIIELAQTQDDECGDGTTSVLIFAAELLDKLVPLLASRHPISICKLLMKARSICLDHLESITVQAKDDELLKFVSSAVSTKLCSILKIPIPQLALSAAQIIRENSEEAKIDIKNNIKIEKILGSFEESEIINGIVIEKDLVHSQMRKNIENPKILLLDCSLEYRKGESVTSMELSGKDDFTRALQIEEEQIKRMCKNIIETGADIVITEKGISDLALSILYQNEITAIRRVKKSDLIRISKATGGTVASRTDDVSSKNIGTAGLFEYVKIGKDYFCKLSKCSSPKAITVILRGPTRDLLTELERNFMDAIKVARNILLDPRLVPGGGATEMSLGIKLIDQATEDELPVFNSCYEALKAIPSILCTNSGISGTLETLHELEKQQRSKGPFIGINGITGEIADMKSVVLEPLTVKSQCIKSAFECVMQLLRVDGIIESKSKQ
ncbi:T-complex protein 1 subunit gamma [Glugoides intestinalis]